MVIVDKFVELPTPAEQISQAPVVELQSPPVVPPKPNPEPTVIPRPLDDLLAEAIGLRNRDGAPDLGVAESDTQLRITFAVNDNLTSSLMIYGARHDVLELLRVAQTERPGFAVLVRGTFSMMDLYGNTSEDVVVEAFYSADTIARINFDNAINIVDNAWKLADSATIHSELRK